MKSTLPFFFAIISLNLSAQIWNQHDILFPNPSQGWRIRPVADNAAWTFGYEIDENFNYLGTELYCQKTNDGGHTWLRKQFKQETGHTGFISDLIGIDSLNAYLSYNDNASGPILYRTQDGGNSWLANNANIDYYLNWVYFFDAMHGVAFGDPGSDGFFQVSHTTDGGESWHRIDSLKSIKYIAADEYGGSGEFDVNGDFMVTRTLHDRVFYSLDKGMFWQVLDTPTNATGLINQIELDDSNTIYLCFANDASSTFQIFKKLFGATDWIEITPVDNVGYVSGINAIPASPTLIFNSGVFGSPETFTSRVSLDGGVNWTVVSSNEDLQLGYVQFADSYTGYACEIPRSFELPSTKAFVYDGSPLTGILSQTILDVNLEIFPNPASEFLKIKFKSETFEDYWILINDINGKLMDKKIINHAFEIELAISLNDFPAGEYFLTMATKDGFVNKKFIKN